LARKNWPSPIKKHLSPLWTSIVISAKPSYLNTAKAVKVRWLNVLNKESLKTTLYCLALAQTVKPFSPEKP
jgi:hypothetical protein